MGYDHFFHFIKDDLVDPNNAFIQNVDNFLFCIYFNYFNRYDSEIKEERNMVLEYFFRNIKTSLMSKGVSIGNSMNKLIDLQFKGRKMNSAEMQINLILYCILVNGLNKTKGIKFKYIKKKLCPLIKILKEIFCEFDKNEIHKERTFIFPLRSPNGTDDDFYIINYKKDLLERSFGCYDGICSSDDDIFEDFYNGEYDRDEYDYHKDYDIKTMFLHNNNNKDEEDERKSKYYSIVLDESLHEGKKEHKL